jgi:peptidyl-prolyl cis-trans isomerase D
MATLEKIRSKAVLLIVVVGAALFAFILGDFLQSGSTFFNQKRENIVTVNGESVHFQDFQARVEERTNAFKMRSGNVNLTEDDHNQIRQAVLDEMIDDILFTEQAARLHLVVSREELVDLVMGENISPLIQQIPDFRNPQTGMFDRDAWLRFLQTVESDNFDMFPEDMLPQLMEMRMAWLNLQDQIIKDQIRRKFSTLVASAILVNEIEAKSNFEGSRISVDFDYVSQSYNSIPDDAVTVSDAEIQKRYNQRRELFRQEEARVINYIAVNIMPSAEDFQAVLAKMESLKESLIAANNVAELVQTNSDVPYLDAYVSFSNLSENLRTFVSTNPVGSIEGPVLIGNTFHLYKFESERTAPDSINLNMLMMPMFFGEAEIQNLADSLSQIVKGGVSFADMALEATGNQTNGAMGWVTEMQLVVQFDRQLKDELFSSNVKLNEPFIAKSSTGTFLVQVSERTAPVKKYKVADIQMAVIPSQETKTGLYNQLSQFMASNHSVQAMRDNANAAGFALMPDVEITRNQMNIGGIQNTRQIVQWAFNNRVGAISDIFESQNNEYFIVAAIENSLKEGYLPLASVVDMLRRELLNEKKGDLIIANLRASNFTSLEQYAEAMNTTPQNVRFVTFNTPSITGIGTEPILNARAPLSPVGEISGPFAGRTSIFVIYVTDKRTNETIEFDSATQRRQMQMQNYYRTYQLSQSPEILRENAKIDSNFNIFF